MTIQNNYSTYSGKGHAGMLARANEAHAFDRGQAGVAVKGGEGVFFDGTKFVKPANEAQRLNVTSIVSYDVGVVASGEIEYAADTMVKLAKSGVFYLVAGETVVCDDALIFDHTSGQWVKAPAVTVDDITTQPKLLVTVVTGGANGELIEARINGQTRA